MMLSDFFNTSVLSVLLGMILLTTSSSVVGTFTFLKKKALIGDAIAHAILPGICLAFMWSGDKNPFILMIGAFVTGWLSVLLIDFIKSKSKIKEDTAIALVLSVSFGIGILMLTHIQHSGNANQTGLNSFLFGKAAALVSQDLIVFSSVATILIISVILLFKELEILSFDEAYAKTLGLPTKSLNLLLTSLTVMAVVIGIQAVGVVLMAATLITPVTAARFWTNKTRHMIFVAALFSVTSGIFGVWISILIPSMPTGPWIVVFISIIAFLSFFFAPKRGVLANYLKRKRLQKRIIEENLLKELFHIGEKQGDFFQSRSLKDILEERFFDTSSLKKSCVQLKKKGFLSQSEQGWMLTNLGKERGQRLVKLHRLWEVYLSEQMNIAPECIHEDAEAIEHIITPELERKLEKFLNYPKVDPHQQKIPY